MPCFPMLCSSFSSRIVTCSHTCMTLLAMPCLDLCIYVFISMLYGQILVFTCLYAWICVLPCFYAYIHMLRCTFICLHAYFHASIYVLGSMFFTCFMPSSMYLPASRLVYVLRSKPCLSCHVLLQPFCSFFRIFLCFSLMVWTRSRPYGLCHHPYTKVHIKGFGSFLFACLCLLALCLCQPLQFQVLPCLAPSASSTLCGYIRCS